MKRIVCVMGCTLLFFLLLNVAISAVFNTGLKRYLCLQPADVLVIGHSMSEMGIDRDLLEEQLGLSVAKYCMNGAGTADRLVMLRHYMEATGTKPKYVIYDVSARSFSSGLADNSYSLFYPFIGSSPVAREYVCKNAPKQEYWLKRLIPLARYDDTRFGAVIRGYRRDWRCKSTRRFNSDAFKVRLANGDFWKITFEPENMRFFDETLTWLDAQGITCYLVALPCVDLINDAEPDLYAKSMAFIHTEADKYSTVSFWDLNGEISTQYDLFRDPIHTNREGQKVATSLLATQLKHVLYGKTVETHSVWKE